MTSTEKLIVSVIVGLLVLLLWASVSGTQRDNEEWERFSAVHQCKVVARIKGQSHTVVTSGAKGQMNVGVAGSNDQTSYLCDDGVTYTR